MLRFKFLLIFIFIAFLAGTAYSAITIPATGYWETTYDCDEWEQHSGSPNCDGLAYNGGWYGVNGEGEQITTDANYPGGGGGRGQRHWACDGRNVGSGGTRITFNTGQTELWFRFYLRIQEGFNWSCTKICPYSTGQVTSKDIYIDMGNPHSQEIILEFGNWHNGIGSRGNCGSGENTVFHEGNITWDQVMSAGSTNNCSHKMADGQWHCYEYHIKYDTDCTDGIAQSWVDGNISLDASNIDFGYTAGATMDYIQILCGSHLCVDIGDNNTIDSTCYYMDLDDLAISKTGRVGPISGGDVTPPTIESATISSNGTTFTIVYDENVSQGSGYNDSDLDVDASITGNNIGMTYSSGDGTPTHVYTLDSTIVAGEVVNLDFNGDSDSLEDDSGNDLEAITDGDVTNSSTQSSDTTAPTLQSAVMIDSDTIEFTFDEAVTFGAGGNSGWWFWLSGGAVTATYASGDGTSVLNYTMSRDITYEEYGVCGYVQPDNGIEDIAGNDLEDIASQNVTNNSFLPIFEEHFEDQNFAARGWYDNTSHGIINVSGYSGSCLEWTWATSDQLPTDGGAMRRLIETGDEIFVRFRIKFSSTWQGSQQAYHPHLITIPSNFDTTYCGLANNYLDTYLEFFSEVGSPYEIRAAFGFQDMLRTNSLLCTPNADCVTCDLTETTEDRSTFCCNGFKSGSDEPDIASCYDYTGQGDWYSSALWVDDGTDISKNAWHKIEIYMKMNTISSEEGQPDGIVKEWVDDVLIHNYSAVLLRTNELDTLTWGQFVLSPWIGDGSPTDQTIYLDELQVYTTQASSPPTISSTTIASDGRTVTVVFDDNVLINAGIDGLFNLDCSVSGDDISMAYKSGDGTITFVFQTGTKILSGETVNLDFLGGTDALEDATGLDVAATSDEPVSNNSSQTVVTEANVSSSGTESSIGSSGTEVNIQP